jgi:flagellar basal body rod protein FlgG
MARIEIKSEPKGALVTINGTALQKTTPVEIQVEAGNYDITIQKDGYKPVRESAIVGVDDRIKIDRPLSH